MIHTRQNFSWQHIAEKMLNIYVEVIDENKNKLEINAPNYVTNSQEKL